MTTILAVTEAVVRPERRDVQTRAGEAPRVKIYATLPDAKIVAIFCPSSIAPAAGTTVLVEHVEGERDDGSTWSSWQLA